MTQSAFTQQGTDVSGLLTTAEAIEASGLGWKVLKTKILDAETRRVIPDEFKLKRSDTGAYVCKGTFTGKLTVLQNDVAFGWFDPFIASEEAAIESAGALRGGARVWMKARLPMAFEPVPGDVVQDGVLLTHSHDGRYAVRIGHAPLRLASQSTLNDPLGDLGGSGFTIRHMPHMMEKLAVAQDELRLWMARVSTAWQEQAMTMVEHGFTVNGSKQFVLDVVQAGAHQRRGVARKLTLEELHPKQRVIAERILELVETGRGADIPGVKGTGWGLYNAVAEYVDHFSSASGETRMTNGLWHGGAQLKQYAAKLASGKLSFE